MDDPLPSDGGDITGLFSVVRCGCSQVVIVDVTAIPFDASSHKTMTFVIRANTRQCS